MKVRIKSGECPSYLTVGKVYFLEEASIGGRNYLIMRNDIGRLIDIDTYRCKHLKGGSWEVIDE